ncbi:uncharacterized protein EI90DRAFT_2019763 [Cantharellus anzutake]|uniref:uncharacterized protein n=1 Tax=Cantharellus anzutake TaxID=1750568 RepID=UPI001905DCAE|nr:uncharacterized protein EI90DRAFT_2019763 [Cantharellus anzutake]KAF8325813.1 hypothetical protein EI90DRAFT_2019763 [Cantharellus anzutake]
MAGVESNRISIASVASKLSTLWSKIPFSSREISSPLAVICSYIETTPDAQRSPIKELVVYKEEDGFQHEFLLLRLAKPAGEEFWVRLERKGPRGTLSRLISSKWEANDMATLSGKSATLLGSTKNVEKTKIIFRVPPSLTDLFCVLEALRESSKSYKLWPENCYFFASVVAEHLYSLDESAELIGTLRWLDLGVEARRRIYQVIASYDPLSFHDLDSEPESTPPTGSLAFSIGAFKTEPDVDGSLNAAARIRILEEENRKLYDSLQLCIEEMAALRTSKSEVSQPTMESNPALNPSTPSGPKFTRSPDASSSSSSTATPTEGNQLKSFKVSLDHPCWRVLPAALKKYKINDDWRQYVMFVCYGSTERCLSYDEKPLLLFQKLKHANKNPVFMLKHIRDIRSPIAIAQKKVSMRVHETVANNLSQPPKDADVAQNAVEAELYSLDTRLHQPPVLLPVSAQAQAEEAASTAAGAQNADGSGLSRPETADSQPDSSRGKIQSGDEPNPHPDMKDSSAVAAGGAISYAIAIYPYLAEQDDEFDVVIDDTYIIVSRWQGWRIVQKDPSGTGVVDDKAAKGWVPTGCILETHIPPALAMSEAKATNSSLRTTGSNPNGSPTTAHLKSPILPSKIISASFLGIALIDYPGRGEHELTLARGDVLRAFKRYNNWSYAIKEDTGDRGWVPSWFVGKGTPGIPLPPSDIPPPILTGTHAGESSTNAPEAAPHTRPGP